MQISRPFLIFYLTGLIGVAFGDSSIWAQVERRHSLLKRLSAADCTTLCNSYSTSLSGCGIDASCMCGTTMVNSLAACVECGLSFGATQAEIDSVESSLNSFASSCAQLGYPITVPSISAPSSNPTSGNGNSPTSTGSDPCATSVGGFDFSAELSSLMGGVTAT